MIQRIHKTVLGCAVILLSSTTLFSQLVDRTTFFENVMGVNEQVFMNQDPRSFVAFERQVERA